MDENNPIEWENVIMPEGGGDHQNTIFKQMTKDGILYTNENIAVAGPLVTERMTKYMQIERSMWWYNLEELSSDHMYFLGEMGSKVIHW